MIFVKINRFQKKKYVWNNKMYTQFIRNTTIWSRQNIPSFCTINFCFPNGKYYSSKIFFHILWKSRCNILVSFPSHLKKLRSMLRFWLEKLNCGFFHSFHSRKNTTKQLFQSKFQCINYLRTIGHLREMKIP